MWVDLAYSLSQGRDRTLTRRAARIRGNAGGHQRDDAPAAGREARFEQLADVIPEGNLIQVFDIAGRRVLPGTFIAAGLSLARALSGAAGDEFSDLEYGGRLFRLLQTPVPVEPPLVILVAGQLEDNRNMMARFTTGLAWASPAMLVLVPRWPDIS